MANPNDHELQGLLHKEFGALGESGRVLQIAADGLDLVARSRWPMLRKPSKNYAQGLTVAIDTRFKSGKLATNQRVSSWLKQTARDHWILAWAECQRQAVSWPNGWPVPSDRDLKEASQAIEQWEETHAQHVDVDAQGRFTSPN